MTRNARILCLLMIAVACVVAVLTCAGCATAARGVVDGSLAPCTSNPNGVSSQSSDDRHRIDALLYSGSLDEAKNRLLATLESLPRTRVVEDRGAYIHATATSLVFRFTDDVEFLFAEPGRIQARSCARSGYSDFGVNRKRIETIRENLAKSAVSSP